MISGRGHLVGQARNRRPAQLFKRLTEFAIREYFIVELLLIEDLLCLCRQLSAWPPHLRLEVVETRMRALDFQAWILRYRVSVARMQCTAGMGEQEFGELIKSLREDGRVRHHDSRRACLSQIGRSRLCGSARRSKAPRNAVLFWRHFMGAYSVPRSSLLTYPSFRRLHRSSSSNNNNRMS